MERLGKETPGGGVLRRTAGAREWGLLRRAEGEGSENAPGSEGICPEGGGGRTQAGGESAQTGGGLRVYVQTGEGGGGVTQAGGDWSGGVSRGSGDR